jgi:hypothetical protein
MKTTVKEMKHCAGATAKAILFEGHPAGRLIANWSDNPAGTVCSASVVIWKGPLKDAKHPKTGKEFNYGNVGKAGGYGYDKLSQAVWQCFNNAGVEAKKVRPANSLTSEEFESWGYVIFDVL